MATYSALDIARWFISYNKIFAEPLCGEPLSRLKLIKLLYYAEGCSLALGNGSLFSEDIEAWEGGPMVVEVYDYYNGNPNSLPLYDEDLSATDKISDDDESILKQVFDVFGQYASWYLRNKVRKETPWIEATDNGKHLGDKINRKTMEKYFKENYIE